MGMGEHLAHAHPSCGKRGLLGTKGLSTVHFGQAPPMKILLLLVFMSTQLDCSNTIQNCTKPCDKNAKCEIRNGSPGCYCSLGFTGPGINATGGSGCYDDNECANATQLCGENANCTNTVGGYFCTCAPGFRSSNGNETFVTNDGTSCVEIPTAKCELNHDCVAEHINRILDKIRKIKEPLAVLQNINQNTVGQISPVDVISYVEALSVSGPLFTTRNISATETYPNLTLNELVNTVNNLVQKDKNAAWEAIPADNRRRTLTKLMHAAEETAALVSQNFKKPAEVEVNASDLVLKVFSFNTVLVDHILQHVHMGGDTIEVATKKKATATSDGTVAVVFLQYSNIGSLLSSSQNFSLKENVEHGETVGSSVIAVAVSSTLPLLYPVEKVTFTLKHAQTAGKKDVKCAFWNYSDTMEGNWSTEGCEQTHFNSTHTSCTCNHLTHFAVLMSSNNSEVDFKDYILTRITQLGIIISLICLSMCIFTFWFFSEIQSTRTTIHKNLCCSLFLAELVFLIGINMSSNKLFCSITAGLLHYFLLAAFAWMCIEGIHLYLIVVGVIYNKGFLHKNFYVFGYVSPAVVVGISAILGYKYYGRPEVCWLSTKNNFIWSFIGPACLIILVNLMAFGVIIYKVFRQTALLKPEVSNYENIRSCARGALSLLFLLGATWIFGVLHVIQGSVVTAYLFTVFNAFQGLFIFIFLCVLSRKIQDEYSRLFRNVPCCFGCLR